MRSIFLAALAASAMASMGRAADPPAAQFEHHTIHVGLPAPNGVGDYGQTALVDIDKNGRLDFVLGRKGEGPLYWFEYQSADRWVQHVVGRDPQSDVGLAALDVVGDGWTDLVCSGVWYRNPGNPRDKGFTRIVYDPENKSAHDVLAADIDGDGRLDIVTMLGGTKRDQRRPGGLVWYKIPSDPTKLWEKHVIGDGIHGAIAPHAAGDIAGNHHTDLVCGDTWYENKDGKGLEWVAHKNVPMGRVGPYGMCVRCMITDMDGDGRAEVVICDADIVDCKMAILKNADGKGGRWEKHELPQSFTYGSLHSLAVADFNGDGRLDIVSNEQEELLPPGRENPRWVLWENQGNLVFKERIILDAKLGGHELQVGDVDGDGRIDICSKAWGPRNWNAAGGQMHVDFLRNVTPKSGK